MFNPLQLNHRELRGLALLLVLLPIAPAALFMRSMILVENKNRDTFNREAAQEQRFLAIASINRFLQTTPRPLQKPTHVLLQNLTDHLQSDLGKVRLEGRNQSGSLLLGEEFPEDTSFITISKEYLGDLPINSLHILPKPPDYEGSFPIGEISILSLVLVIGIMAGGAVNRQLKINEIENHSLAMIAHELKTPIASSRVMLDSLKEGIVSSKDAVQEYLGILLTENLRMHDLVENFLTHAKLEGKGISMHLEPLQVSDVFQEIEKSYLPRFKSAAGSLTFPGKESEGAMVMADRPAFLRILLCLLDNALKYSNAVPVATLSVVIQGNTTQIRVADRGPGIPQSERAKVFDKFYQIDRRLERSQEGCGLGLAIARKLAIAQGGKLSVEANPRGGSCFVVSLPTYRSNAGSERTKRSRKRAELASKDSSPADQKHSHPKEYL